MKKKFGRMVLALLGLLAACAVQAQTVTALRATEIRADKLPSAPVLSALPAGATLSVIAFEGGWAQITHESAQGRLSGWVRASALSLSSAASAASGMVTGRQASGGAVLALGVRSLPARSNRHALIVGISRYADPGTPPLPGARIDRESATQMASAMQVPASNITYLQDEQATGDNIRMALRELTDRVQDGDRVFIHYSGHGTRSRDAATGGCVEALLAYEGGRSAVITNREMASLLQPVTSRADKLFVMVDAGYAGGLDTVPPVMRMRGLANLNDEGLLRPKFASISDECRRPVNVKTRDLMVELNDMGALPQDIIHLSASRDNEVSFDDAQKGGLATQYVRDCMLRDALDLDKSGAISMDEIRQCAQEKINKRMHSDANYKAHHLMLAGNTGFVPAWFSQAQIVGASVMPRPVPPAPVAAAPAVAADALTGEQALRQMFEQRAAKRRVQLGLSKAQLKIGQDTMDFSVKSDRPGYVYVALAGSDNKSVYLLFPNDLDQDNRIEAGQTLQLPRANWRVTADGPAGNDNLLVLVTDGPRDLNQLAAAKVGPFAASLNDADGRARLGALMSTSRLVTSQACLSSANRKNNPLCSDAFGAAMVALEEVN